MPKPTDVSTPAATSRSVIVGAHLLLVVFAVVVVWATTGRDAGTVADASVARAVSNQTVSAEQNLLPAITEPALEAPHTLAMPLPQAEPTASFAQPIEPIEPIEPTEASEPAKIHIPRPVAPAEPFNPMVAIPEPDAVYPPVLPTAAEEEPYYDIGGLYGTPGAARVVYVIDASGSLIDTLPFILRELQGSIDELTPEQSFAVLFFSGDQVTEAPPYGMKRATTRAVRHTREWIDPGSGRIIASGRSNADAAIRRALAYQPDAVILLSDGLTGQGDQALARRARLLSLIDTANTQDAVFHTLQVRRPDPLATPTRLGTLEHIALQSGGVHRYLSEEDLLPAGEPAITRGPGVGDRTLPLR